MAVLAGKALEDTYRTLFAADELRSHMAAFYASPAGLRKSMTRGLMSQSPHRCRPRHVHHDDQALSFECAHHEGPKVDPDQGDGHDAAGTRQDEIPGAPRNGAWSA
jgi:hypothetical protein